MDIRGVNVEAGDYIAYRLHGRLLETWMVFAGVLGGNLRYIATETYLPTISTDAIWFNLIDEVRVIYPRGTVVHRPAGRVWFTPGDLVRATVSRNKQVIEGKVVSDLRGVLVVETESGAIAVGEIHNWVRLV
ncbi:MAG: hypothetical protein NTV39_04620 [Candidatus Saccharibacteria bacterium]|nr:hypothetical protein [Candidatus Saccharibacteria bacterium]